jgi:hypothetical protein
MTLDEYKRQILVQQKLNDAALRNIAEEYAFSNAKAKVGDIVRDHCETIVVESVRLFISMSSPCALYYGESLKNNGSRRAKRYRTSVYDSNLKFVNGKEVER